MQSNVKVGVWKCSGKTSRTVLVTVSDLAGKVEKTARKLWMMQ